MSNKMYDFGHAHAPHTYTDPDLSEDVERRTDELDKAHAEAVGAAKKIGKNSGLTVTGKQQAANSFRSQNEMEFEGLGGASGFF